MNKTKMIKQLLLGAVTMIFSINTVAQNPDTNFVVKDAKTDNLLTGENSVLLVIDWQPDLIKVVANIDQKVLLNNIQVISHISDLLLVCNQSTSCLLI